MSQIVATQIFGEFTDNLPVSEEYLTLHFSPDSAPRRRRWSNYGLSADFLGDYFAAFFPGDTIPDSSINRHDSVKATVSYIANELLENAVKYSDASAKLPISISLHLYEQQIIFHAVNYAGQASAEKYQAFVQALLGAELEKFYMQQLEKAAMGIGESNMGILTMINDYAARFSWKFQVLEQQPDIMQVNVLVHLDI